jgi:hypothetical protein
MRLTYKISKGKGRFSVVRCNPGHYKTMNTFGGTKKIINRNLKGGFN